MRTKTLLSIAAALAAGMCATQAQVYSVNIVGYVNQEFAGDGQFTAVASPLDDGTNTLASLLSGLPANSQVLMWDGAQYQTVTRIAFGSGWSGGAAGDTPLLPGEGAFIKTPAGNPVVTNTWVGQVVPGDYTNSLPDGFTLVGNQIPVAGTATEIGLTAAIPAAGSSQILEWDAAAQQYIPSTRIAFGAGWSPSEPSFDVAQGFFVNNLSGAPIEWVQSLNQ